MRGFAARGFFRYALAFAAVIAGCGDDAWDAPNDNPPSDARVDPTAPVDASAGQAGTGAAGQTGTVVLIGERDAATVDASASNDPGAFDDDMIASGQGGAGVGGLGAAGIGPLGGAGGAPSAEARLIGNAFAITSENRILGLDYVTAQLLGTRELTGLNEGETVLAADVRTLDGELYALTSKARVVRIDLETGETHETAALAADGDDTSEPFAALKGARFAADWDPLIDRLGLFSDAGQQLRVDADTGMTATDSVAMSPAAYALDTADATQARLYAIDRATRTLFASPREPGSPQGLAKIGTLDGAGEADLVDFEITTTRAGALVAIAVVSDADGTRLLDVNLAVGDATCPRTLPLDPGERVIAFTAVPPRATLPAH